MATKLEIRQRSDAIIAMVEDGNHIKEVAKYFSINPTSVTSILRKRGVTWRKGKFSKLDIADIKAAYSAGNTILMLAKKYDVAEPTMLHLIKSCGISTRTSLQTKRLNAKPILSTAFSEDSELCAYLYGWLLTDGCISDGGRVSIEISRNDEIILGYFKDYIKSSNKVGRRDRVDSRTGNTYLMSSFSFYDKRISDTLFSYGLSPRKSLNEKCPTTFRNNRHFWRGVLEGDGHISKTNNLISLAGSLELIEEFYKYCRTICGAMKGTVTVNNEMRIAQVCNFEHVSKILHELYRDTDYVLPRKYQVYLDRYK